MTTDTSDVRWLTYDELGAALGITPDSARRLVARKKWPRRAGNDGRARIGVPAERIPDKPPVSPPDARDDVDADDGPDARDDVIPVVSILTQHIDRLEKELQSVKNERDEERIRAAQLAIQAAQVDALNVVIEVERQRAEDARRRTEELKQQTEELKAERDRWASALEASQRQITHLQQAEKLVDQAEKAAAERRGWFGWLKRA
ncbi:hypothetical protein [Microvirga aerophila]|uniref:Uncharacterized protein n=1 Tax=Microvirga aerophila TaxID=670291 RepID=A0A512C1K7_9HYPH|nr:hypothetical protein [Microvirga aerophila]GEO18080.1 hypothetical protein MAE02_57760 [Microvirga aerophila]